MLRTAYILTPTLLHVNVLKRINYIRAKIFLRDICQFYKLNIDQLEAHCTKARCGQSKPYVEKKLTKSLYLLKKVPP